MAIKNRPDERGCDASGRLALRCQLLTLIGPLAVMAPSIAAAQQLPDDDRKAPSAADADIVVTARKRDERLQDVPIAITAATGEKLEQLGITDVTELSSITPGLNTGVGVGFVTYFLRGVGSGATIPGVENSVATYIDGVYIARPTSALQQLQNLERVEVLRGPQGTLFGRNATGGLINIITKKPSNQFEGSLRFNYANKQVIEGSGYVSVPFSDFAAASISVAARHQGEGYGRNLLLGTDLYASNYINVRGQLKIQATDSLTLLLAGYYNFTDNSVSAAYSIPAGARPTTANGGTLVGGAPVGPARFTTEPRKSFSNDPAIEKLRDYGASLTITQEWDSIELTSITAWNRSIGSVSSDFDLTDAKGWSSAFAGPGAVNNPTGAPTVNPTSGFLATYKFPYFISQELRLGSTGDNKFDWVVGLYGQHNEDAYSPILAYNSTVAAPSWEIRGLLAAPGFSQSIVGRVKNKAYAIFAQGTYSVTDKFDLTGGIRYNYEKKNFLGQAYAINAAGTTATLLLERTAEKDWKRATWNLTGTYKFNPNAMVYASYNRGFRSGVFNTSSPTATTPVNEEVIDALEAGVKTSWMDGGLTINASVFSYDYKNLQFLIISPTTGTAVLANAAGAKIRGLDFEMSARPFEGVNLFANLSLIDSKYSKFDNYIARVPQVNAQGNPTGGTINTLTPVVGNDLMQTPPFSLSAGGSIRRPVSNSDMTLEFASDVTWKGRYFLNPEQTIKQPAFATVNASMTLRIPSGRQTYSVALWGRNLTNHDVIIAGSTVFNTLRVLYNEPRTFGIRVGVDF